MNDFGIAPERSTIGMIRCQVDAPRIIDQKQQLQSNRPLHGVDQIFFTVDIGHNPTPGFILDIQVAPFSPGQLVQQVLPETIGGGLEVGVVGNVSLKAEYLFVDLSDFNCGLNCSLLPSGNVSFHANLFRGGLNVRF